MAQNRVGEVLRFADHWIGMHMAVNDLRDAVLPQEFVPYQQISPQLVEQYRQRCLRQPNVVQYMHRPLHFQSVEFINRRRYLLQLEKRQHDLVLLNFTLTCLDQSSRPADIIQQTSYIMYDALYHNQSDCYHSFLQIPVDNQYITGMRFTRV